MGMKQLAIITLFALALALYGCSTTTIRNANQIITNISSGNWEAQLTGGIGSVAGLNFVTQFTVTNTTGQNTAALDITGFSFINAGSCFGNNLGAAAASEAGSSTLNTDSTGQVSGSMDFAVTSSAAGGAQAGNVLMLTTASITENGIALPPGGVSGTSSGTSTTTGTLSHGVVWGNWSLTSTDTKCIPTSPVYGAFIMCQGVASCSIP
jgi:hypothetical protein